MQPQNSGYDGTWVVINNAVFNNQFYINLLDANPSGSLSYKTEIPKAGSKVQWTSGLDIRARTPSPTWRLMLNSDMCLVKEFTTDSNGFPNCNYGSCNSNVEPAQYVKAYAASEPGMKADWSSVFTKMLSHGYENTNKLIDIIPTSTSENARTDYKTETRNRIMKSFETSSPKEQFKIFHFVYEKKYETDSEEGLKKFENFKNNLKVIQEYNGQWNNANYVITAYDDMNLFEYLFYRYRIEAVRFEEFSDLKFDSFEHLLVDA